MKIVKRIIVGIVLVATMLSITSCGLLKSKDADEYTGAYFTLGEDGTTHYIPGEQD